MLNEKYPLVEYKSSIVLKSEIPRLFRKISVMVASYLKEKEGKH